ncbi:MAG: autoinducer binding domain-containing protein [Methylococcaceae bacterium]|jgi:LuxR family transcriptional regulator
MRNWQEDQLQALQTIECEKQLFKTFISFSEELGFDHCAYGLRLALPITNPKTYLVNNYPTAWQTQYQDNHYIDIDPTVQRAMHSILPIPWTDELFSATPELWESAKSFGLRYGWGQSIRDCNGAIGLMTLARSKEAISSSEIAAKGLKIIWLAQICHLAMSRLLTSKLAPEANVILTAREQEVLRWTADGKTSHEISCILNIKERTVNFHVNNTLTKLNTTNKTAAAIKASLLGLI